MEYDLYDSEKLVRSLPKKASREERFNTGTQLFELYWRRQEQHLKNIEKHAREDPVGTALALVEHVTQISRTSRRYVRSRFGVKIYVDTGQPSR